MSNQLSKKHLQFKKTDFILLAVMLIIAASIFIFFRPQKIDGLMVEVRFEGKTIESFPLNQNIEKNIQTRYGNNRLIIKDHKAKIIEANCPDQLCVYQKAIAKPGETLVCLPHQLVVEVVGDAPSEVDSISN